ncbi:MAG TPA: purine-nucleoside phosphorylase [Pyrinomonadaceae bacterium]|nr:purine-nucleoside phosphorylase [Pyrinomonadaceae bacterium]
MVERMASTSLYERAEHATRIIRARINVEPRIAVVLGSGLGGFADDFEDATGIPYEEIPGFMRSTAQGHAGRLVVGKVDNVPLVAMQGRVHYYEGYSLEEVTFPVRTFSLLGIKTLILTNAAGGINVQLTQGGLMVLTDHLNLIGDNPLRGANDERFGPRFPDMSSVYSPELQELAIEEAKGIGVEVRRGVYCALSGPSYETPAEIHLLRNLGADAVGMSTVPEAIVARHMGLEVLGISCITNMAAGISDEPINHDEVMATGNRVRESFTELLRRIVAGINKRVIV